MFVLEDNHWAESTPESQHSPIRDLSERAKAFGMKALKADGQDVEAVYKTTRQALDHARSGKGPVFIHLDTVRFSGVRLRVAATQGRRITEVTIDASRLRQDS